jgi:hypothetical protein
MHILKTETSWNLITEMTLPRAGDARHRFAASALILLLIAIAGQPMRAATLLSCTTTPTSVISLEGNPAFNESWVCANSNSFSVDVLWVNQTTFYVTTGVGGVDPSDRPVLGNFSIMPGPVTNGTDWFSVVPASSAFTLSFNVDPSLNGNDGPPWDRGWTSISMTLYLRKHGTASWNGPYNSPTYMYTALDFPEPSTVLTFSSGLLMLGGVLRRKLMSDRTNASA